MFTAITPITTAGLLHVAQVDKTTRQDSGFTVGLDFLEELRAALTRLQDAVGTRSVAKEAVTLTSGVRIVLSVGYGSKMLTCHGPAGGVFTLPTDRFDRFADAFKAAVRKLVENTSEKVWEAA